MLRILGITAGRVALAAAIGMAAANGAAAQDGTAAAAVRGKQAGDFLIGLSAIGVLPEQGGAGTVDVIGGRPQASNSATGQLDFTYFVTPNLALNLIAATTKHDVEVRGSALGDVDLGTVWALPPTLTLQYHPFPRERVSPYVGLGINYTVFYSEGGTRNAAVTDVKIDNSWSMAFNLGLDVEVTPNWLFNFDVKRLQFLEPEVTVDTVIGRINARADLNPWVIGAGIRYRF